MLSQVNNAAFQMVQQDITDITNEQWIKTFDTNIHSFFFLSKLIVPHMKQGDVVINCASINAYIGRPDLLDYTSTKGGKYPRTWVWGNQANTSPSGCIIHTRSCQSTDEQRHSGQCCLPGPSMDSSHPEHDGPVRARSIHFAYGQACSAQRDCHLFCLSRKLRQQHDQRSKSSSQWRRHCQWVKGCTWSDMSRN